MSDYCKFNKSDMVSISRAAKEIGVHPDTLVRWDEAGKLVAMKTIGGHRRYKLSEIKKLMEDSCGRIIQNKK